MKKQRKKEKITFQKKKKEKKIYSKLRVKP